MHSKLKCLTSNFKNFYKKWIKRLCAHRFYQCWGLLVQQYKGRRESRTGGSIQSCFMETTFFKQHELAYSETKIGAGPNGETVVIQIDKKNPHLQKRLWQTFSEKHLSEK